MVHVRPCGPIFLSRNNGSKSTLKSCTFNDSSIQHNVYLISHDRVHLFLADFEALDK